ncbi:MAG: leucyl aminopeptidase family protein [Myxococcales bacterium]|nr:leucyl aminopeptidase family protein [Myxococcales bacterium]
MQYLIPRAAKGTLDLHVLAPDAAKAFVDRLPAAQKAWLADTRFEPKAGEVALIPGEGGISAALAVVSPDGSPWPYAHLATRLSGGRYQVAHDLEPQQATDLALGFALGTYAFTRYKPCKETFASLVWPKEADKARATWLYEAITLVRDLITTPAGDLGPAELAEAAKKVAADHKAKVTVTSGKALERGYPAVHAVGKGSSRPPCLVDITWGHAKDPKVTLVGKGVVFDTGGLDLKPGSAMKLMKKDMGGAAHVLGLAHAVMSAKLPVRLRVLIPAVENSVSGDAFRPLDVLQTRKGLTVEVGNTDAEGRLILCDALHEACQDKPELLLDFATLTGAARVALGTDVPALFASDDALAQDWLTAGEAVGDQLWRMPLWQGYRRQLDSKVADLNNISEGAYGGAITAALFLQEFVAPGVPWGHVDVMAYNLSGRPGRPAGGEAMGLRAAFTMLERRYPPATKAKAAPAPKGKATRKARS